MRTYCVLLHVLAALLLCDHGMFFTASPSDMSTSVTSNIIDSNTTVTTAESTKEPYTEDVFSGQSELTTSTRNNETLASSISSTEFERGKNATGKKPLIFSTPYPTSTPHEVNGISQGSPTTGDSASLTWGIVILIFILILIVLLLGILYILRKKGRSYSFDLTRAEMPANDYVDTPLRSDQQGISYEQTNKDLPVCLDYIQEDKSEEKTNSIANGSAGEKTEQTPTNENDEQNVPEENSFSSNSSLDTPMEKVEFNLDLDLLGGDSDLNGLTEAEATDAEKNENNNNVSNAGRGTAEEVFTEISLDEPKNRA